MKLNLTNKKQHKNCQYFIKALKQIEKHNMKQVQRPVFLCVTKEELKLAPSLIDFHRERMENTCLITIKADGFTVRFDQPENEGKVYMICTYKMLRAFKKNQNKIVLIELYTAHEGMEMYFQIENKLIQCTLKVEAEQTNEIWPQYPESTNQTIYQLIDVGKITDEELKYLSMKEEEQLWIQFWQSGMLLRNITNGKFTKQDKIIFKEDGGFNHLNLRSKLKNRNFINLRGEFFLQSLYECQKRKKVIEVKIKNIYDRYLEQEIRFSYMLIKTQMEYGTLLKIVSCFISDQMGQLGEQHIRRQYNKDREPPRQSLLKSQESYQHLKTMIFNRFNQIDAEAKINQEIMKQRRPLGKIEQGQQTFTRKYYSRN